MRSRNQRSWLIDHGAAGEVEQRLLERAQRVDVEVVGRLVEQQQVAAALQQLGEVHAVALAARERADLALLLRALEVEPRDVGARRDLALAQLDLVLPARDLLPDGLVGVERVAALIDVADLHGLAERQRPGVGRLLPGDHPEQRRLAGAVGADHADDAAARQREGQVVDQQVVAVALLDAARLDDDVAEARARAGCRSRPIRSSARVLVRAAARRRSGAPCPSPAARAATCGSTPARAASVRWRLRLGLLLQREPLLLLLEPRRVVALPGNAAAAIELENPAGDVVEEVAIVRDGDDGARVLLQEALEPRDRLGVEVVGRLVEQQQVRATAGAAGTAPRAGARRPRASSRRRRAAAGAARPSRARGASRGPRRWPRRSDPARAPARRAPCPSPRATGPRRASRSPRRSESSSALISRDALLDVAAARSWRRRAAAPAAGSRPTGRRPGKASPTKAGVLAGHDPQQRALPGAVQAEDADLRARQERQPDVLENAGVGRVDLPEPLHRVDKLWHL